MPLPLFLSVPHAGLVIPPEVERYNRLSPDEIRRDGDEGAAEIYDLRNDVQAFQTTAIARVFIDMNRQVGDRSPDGIVKTHTCWNIPVYDPTPPEDIFDQLIERYWKPYHQALTDAAELDVLCGIDCHTMAEFAPQLSPDSTGEQRPWVAVGNLGGTSIPDAWTASIVRHLSDQFEGNVTINAPFAGGYITRTHVQEMRWFQIELSRGAFMTNDEKRERVLRSLVAFCDDVGPAE